MPADCHLSALAFRLVTGRQCRRSQISRSRVCLVTAALFVILKSPHTSCNPCQLAASASFSFPHFRLAACVCAPMSLVYQPALPALDTDTEDEDIAQLSPRRHVSLPIRLERNAPPSPRRPPVMAFQHARQTPPTSEQIILQPMPAPHDGILQKSGRRSSAERSRAPTWPPVPHLPMMPPTRTVALDRDITLAKTVPATSQGASTSLAVNPPVRRVPPLRMSAPPNSHRRVPQPSDKMSSSNPHQAYQQHHLTETPTPASFHLNARPPGPHKTLAKPHQMHEQRRNPSSDKSSTGRHVSAALRRVDTVPPMSNGAPAMGVRPHVTPLTHHAMPPPPRRTNALPHAIPSMPRMDATPPQAMGAAPSTPVSRGIKKHFLHKWCASNSSPTSSPSNSSQAHPMAHASVQPYPAFEHPLQRTVSAQTADVQRRGAGHVQPPSVQHTQDHSRLVVPPIAVFSQSGPSSSARPRALFLPSLPPPTSRHPQPPQNMNEYSNLHLQQKTAIPMRPVPQRHTVHGSTGMCASVVDVQNCRELKPDPLREPTQYRITKRNACTEKRVPTAVRSSTRKPRRYPKLLAFDVDGVPVAVRKVAEAQQARELNKAPERATEQARKTEDSTEERAVDNGHEPKQNELHAQCAAAILRSARRERVDLRPQPDDEYDSMSHRARGLLRVELERVQRAASARYHIKMNLRGRTKLAMWLQRTDADARAAVALAVTSLDLNPALLSRDAATVRSALSSMRNSPLRVLEALSARLGARDGVLNWAFVVRHMASRELKETPLKQEPGTAAVPSGVAGQSGVGSNVTNAVRNQMHRAFDHAETHNER